MPIFKSSRKVQAFGSSLALTLPAFFVKANEVKKGSIMKILYGLDGVMVASSLNDTEAIINSLITIMDKLEEHIRNPKAEKGEKNV